MSISLYASDLSAASPSHSCEITQSNPSPRSGMVQPVVNEMFATVHAAGSSLLGLFTSCTTFDSTLLWAESERSPPTQREDHAPAEGTYDIFNLQPTCNNRSRPITLRELRLIASKSKSGRRLCKVTQDACHAATDPYWRAPRQRTQSGHPTLLDQVRIGVGARRGSRGTKRYETQNSRRGALGRALRLLGHSRGAFARSGAYRPTFWRPFHAGNVEHL
eukprot:scaffold28826_cov253-Isochrysis_galbana.AAC.7